MVLCIRGYKCILHTASENMCTQVKESLAEETLQEIEKENALSNESSHTSNNGIGHAVKKTDHFNQQECCLSEAAYGCCHVRQRKFISCVINRSAIFFFCLVSNIAPFL